MIRAANIRFRCSSRIIALSESLLLSLKGKTVDFLVQRENKQEVVTGKIIRSGYTPHNYMAMNLSHSSRWAQCGAGALARERPKVYHPSEREGTPSAAKSAKRDG